MVFYTRALKVMPRKAAFAMLLAANTFAAWADNKLHIKDFNVEVGKEYTVSVLLENDVDIIGLNAKLNLPEGLEIQTVAYEGDEVKFVKNEIRFC